MPLLLEGRARNILLLRAEPYRNRVHGDLSRWGAMVKRETTTLKRTGPRWEPGRLALEWRLPCKEILTG
jgi:hypothetical protein